MGFSVLIARRRHRARAGKFYVDQPGDLRAARASGSPARTALLSNKYYVDELYGATVIAGTFGARPRPVGVRSQRRRRRGQRRRLADGDQPWFSGLTDRTVVDGAGQSGRLDRAGVEPGSAGFQTGLVQNYALLMLFGIFAFVSVYLFVR